MGCHLPGKHQSPLGSFQMARTNKASQKPASKSKPWKETLHRSAHKHATGHVAGQEKPLVPVHLKVSLLQLIRRSQNAQRMALDKLPFLSFAKKVAHGFEKNFHFQAPALLALREAGQAYLLGWLEDCSMCAIHAKRVTVTSSDIRLTRCLRGGMIPRSGAVPAWQHLALNQMVPV